MRILIILSFGIIIISCNGFNNLKDAFDGRSPHETYKALLEKPEFRKSTMSRLWIQAGEEALKDSVFVTLPHTESGYFKASLPEAHAFRFRARDGQKVTISLTTEQKHAETFVDLYKWDNSKWQHLAFADSSYTLEHEFRDNAYCILRIQPELLVNLYYVLSIDVTPQLINPVSGASNNAIQSIFGDPRDGGRRSHEGIDIFAKKGTPVIAPAAGRITQIGESTLGGNVIWMRDTKRGLSYYFAHLDTPLVDHGRPVEVGDTLGLVGNTGNARYTSPHLHFGIYRHGPLNPIGYIQNIRDTDDPVAIDTTVLGKEFKVSRKKVNIREGPGTHHRAKTQLLPNTYLEVIGEDHNWYRVKLADQTKGYIYKTLVEKINSGKLRVVNSHTPVLFSPDSTSAPISYLKDKNQAEVLAYFEDYEYIRTHDDLRGWIKLNK